MWWLAYAECLVFKKEIFLWEVPYEVRNQESAKIIKEISVHEYYAQRELDRYSWNQLQVEALRRVRRV